MLCFVVLFLSCALSFVAVLFYSFYQYYVFVHCTCVVVAVVLICISSVYFILRVLAL